MTTLAQVLDGARCLLFDYGGTLDADGVAWKEQFHALYREEGVAIAVPAFDRAFYDADDPLVGTLPAGTGLADTVRLLVAGLEARLGDDAARGRRVVERFLADTDAAMARNRPVLAALRQHYRLGIVSNWYGNLTVVCRELGLDTLFDAIADSEVVGVTKPDPALFHAAMTPLGAAPPTTVMIGDSLRRDGEGARRVGCGFIWLTPEGHAGDTCRIAGLGALTRVPA